MIEFGKALSSPQQLGPRSHVTHETAIWSIEHCGSLPLSLSNLKQR